MGKLLERTMQRQHAEQNAKIDELTALVRQLAAAPNGAGPIVATPATDSVMSVGAGSALVGQTVHQTNQINHVANQVINIVPWDGERRITVRPEEIVAAFAQNGRLREYTGYSDYDLANHDIASPYVTELLMDLVKRGHADPAARNVYLNPRRADQVLVHMRGGRWEVLPLATATRLLCDGVAETVHKIALSYAEARRLPLEAQNALAIAGMLYEERPDAYVDQVKKPMAAHLTNMAPA